MWSARRKSCDGFDISKAWVEKLEDAYRRAEQSKQCIEPTTLKALPRYTLIICLEVESLVKIEN
jgi:hypothetical protein